MEEKYTFFVKNNIYITHIDNKFLLLESKEQKYTFELNEEYYLIGNKCRWSIMNMHLYLVILIVKWMDLETMDFLLLTNDYRILKTCLITFKSKWMESRKLFISSKIWWDIGGRGHKPYFWYW